MKAALALVALYAMCILAPHAAMAFGNNTAAHCLTEGQVAAHIHAANATPHAHTGGGEHHHHDDGVAQGHADSGAPHEHSDQSGKGHGENCCGLFCVSAIALNTDTAFHAPTAVSATPPGLHDTLAGRGPDRLIRPPIA